MEIMAHQAAERLGLTVPALHYYEKAGLLPPVKRNEAGCRVYGEADMEWLYMVVCMREAGLPVRDIRRYVELLLQGPDTIARRYELVGEYRRKVEEKIRTMQSSLQLLKAKAGFYQEILEAGEDISCSDFAEEWKLFKQRMEGGKC